MDLERINNLPPAARLQEFEPYRIADEREEVLATRHARKQEPFRCAGDLNECCNWPWCFRFPMRNSGRF
jgi:hypothetical protein